MGPAEGADAADADAPAMEGASAGSELKTEIETPEDGRAVVNTAIEKLTDLNKWLSGVVKQWDDLAGGGGTEGEGDAPEEGEGDAPAEEGGEEGKAEEGKEGDGEEAPAEGKEGEGEEAPAEGKEGEGEE